MADPLILSLAGVELELRAFRGQTVKFDVTVTDSAGAVVNLGGYDLILTLVDRPGGTVKYTDTNIPADHFNAAGGQSRFVIPASAYTGLTGQRPFTWKYQIILRDRVTDDRYPVFFGDYRVLAPMTTV